MGEDGILLEAFMQIIKVLTHIGNLIKEGTIRLDHPPKFTLECISARIQQGRLAGLLIPLRAVHFDDEDGGIVVSMHKRSVRRYDATSVFALQ